MNFQLSLNDAQKILDLIHENNLGYDTVGRYTKAMKPHVAKLERYVNLNKNATR